MYVAVSNVKLKFICCKIYIFCIIFFHICCFKSYEEIMTRASRGNINGVHTLLSTDTQGIHTNPGGVSMFIFGNTVFKNKGNLYEWHKVYFISLFCPESPGCFNTKHKSVRFRYAYFINISYILLILFLYIIDFRWVWFRRFSLGYTLFVYSWFCSNYLSEPATRQWGALGT